MRKLAAILTGLILVAGGVTACSSPHHAKASSPVTTTPPTVPPAATLAPLGKGSTYVATLVAAPVGYAREPNGPVAGQIPAQTWYNPTIRPVFALKDGWYQVGLDTKPNGSTGWVAKDSLTLFRTPYKIVISVSQRSLTLYKDGVVAFTSPVGVGAPQWPTPVGDTFVSSIVATSKSQLGIYGPTVLVLGIHSAVFTEFDGGDGTVAIHGYPSNPASTKGVAVTHGCIRVSVEAMDAIKVVPTATPVSVVA